MKLKKFLLITFAAVGCLCLGFAFGCKDDPKTDSRCTVSFSLSDSVNYVVGGETVEEYELKVDKNSNIEFSVEVKEGYLPETIVVKADGETLAASDGVYSYNVTANVTVVATAEEDLLEVDEEDGAFLISSLKDLRFVADMVNSGYTDYVIGNYRLENDIDCGGAQLDIIGNFDNQYAFFAGIFDGQNHTISNYTIDTNGKTYVGLFGCIQLSTVSDATMVLNLNLKDFKINAAAAENGSVIVGAIAGYSAGANVVACSAVNGEINIAGSAYFSYAGGAVGIQESLSVTGSDGVMYHYHSSVEYVHTNVMISATGYVFAAGGIVGYSVTSHERAATMILNSYSEGNIYGAVRSGGIVGSLDDYSSVANCYSKGLISATVRFPDQVDDEYYFAYAGGIAGYVGNDTVISDSFSVSTVYASSTNTNNKTGEIYAGSSAATEFTNSVILYNCYSGSEVNATSASFVKNSLKWNEVDWVIADGAYPTTNLSQGKNSFELTLSYLGHSVGGDASKNVSVTIEEDSYFPFSSYAGVYFDEIIVSDDAGYSSFGFFFDEDCTLKVPYSYIPTRGVTVYVGFANYAEVAGSYEYAQSTGRTVQVVLNTDGSYNYVDVWDFSGLTYTYDGTKIIFSDALFARLSSNVLVDNVAQPWLNYQPYKFVGTVSGNKLYLYDGAYFTYDEEDQEDGRLVFASATSQTSASNGFIGTWERSATVNEKYTFTEGTAGRLNWTYSWKGTTLSGTATVSNGVATLSGQISATATIDASGLLYVERSGEGKYFSLVNSFYGNWYSQDTNDYFILNGYGTALSGTANAIIDGVVYDSLAYVKDGFFEAVTSNEYTYTVLSGYALFGYFTYNAETKTITAMFYDESAAGFIEYNFILLDYYIGSWIGEEEVNGVPFTFMNFNGFGLYKTEGDALLGYVIIDGTKVDYECSVENGLDGTFTYKGVEYTLTTNGDGTVTVSAGSASANLYRQDEMANTPLVDADNNVYTFNGGGNLTNGGTLTVTDEFGKVIGNYIYKIVSGSVDELNIVINLYENSVDGSVVGTITIEYPKFVIELDGEEKNLDLYFPFAGRQWSISSIMNSFYIGKFDLTYEATGTYNGENDIPFVYFPEYNYIYIFYGNAMDRFVQMYLLLQNDGNLIVSSYPYLVSGDYHYAAPSDGLVGLWINTETGAEIEFDGLADSMYVVGVAIDYSDGLIYYYTRRFGTIYMWLATDESVAYTVELTYDDELSGNNVYRKENARFDRLVLTATDVLSEPIFTATATDGTVYGFNFDGTVEVGGKTGTYLLDSVNGNETTVEITVDGTTFTAVLNHAERTLTVID